MKKSNLDDKLAHNFSLILDNADAGYVLYNYSLNIMAFNQKAQQFSNAIYNKELLAGNHILTYFPKERHEYLLNVIARVSAGERVIYEIDFFISGKEIWLETRWLCVKNVDDDEWGFILTSKDITDRKLELLHMKQTTQYLLDRNKTLEQFGHIVGHNLKAPVANIASITELLNNSDDDQERNIYLEYIHASAQALTGVVADIGRLLTTRQTVNEATEEICFAEVLEEIKKTINYFVIKEHINIRDNFDETLCIHTVKSFIGSLFYNLISNSVKYRRNGVLTEIEIIAEKDNNGVSIQFKDNGKGIDLNKYENKLFGLYNRFDTSVEGCGIGLYMVKSQIEQIGGRITVESKVGIGTVFTIAIPDLAA